MQKTAVSTRFDAETLARLDEIVKGLNTSRTAIIQKAVSNYLDYDFWFKKQVAKGLSELKQGKAASHEQVKNSIREMGYDAY